MKVYNFNEERAKRPIRSVFSVEVREDDTPGVAIIRRNMKLWKLRQRKLEGNTKRNNRSVFLMEGLKNE